jgi:uncharacterized protein
MKERSFDPRALNLSAFCKQGQALQGQWPLAGMQRLVAGLAAVPVDEVSWQVQGQLLPVTGGEAQTWLTLEARAQVLLQCQRCLQPLTEALNLERRFRFVRNEDEAARLDEESEDDVLALPARLDLHELLEDELILALPLVPRHETCPQPLPLPETPADAAEPAPKPFAALAALAALKGREPR